MADPIERVAGDTSSLRSDVNSSEDQAGHVKGDETPQSSLGSTRVQSETGSKLKVYELAETRTVTRKYVFQRPRALQYAYHGHVVTAGDEEQAFAVSPSISRQTSSSSKSMLPIKEHQFLGIKKLRERLDLFIDLIWVGIITNLSEVFSSRYFEADSRRGVATLIFLLAFIGSWRIWNMLREFLGNYYMDDVLQRFFVFWILVLSMIYGNNIVYLTGDVEHVKTIVIVTYLLIRSSFFLMEAVYSFFIPWLRHLILLQFLLLLPSVGLWLAAIFVRDGYAAAPVTIALLWEYLVPMIVDSPLADRLISKDYRKAMDTHHFRSRFASFFIVTVGEGVLLLIAKGPLGFGVTATAGVSVWALLLYFLLSFLYFNRDMSKTVVPAVKRKGWRLLAWVFFHIPMFACILTLEAAVMFLLRETSNAPDKEGKESEKLVARKVAKTPQQSAIWCVGVSLSIIVFSMTAMALLDKPLDPPGTLRVDNRFVRLHARGIYILVLLCVPIVRHIDPTLFLGIASVGLQIVFAWEWYASLERGGGGFVEPRSLAVMLAKDKRKRRPQGASMAEVEQSVMVESKQDPLG